MKRREPGTGQASVWDYPQSPALEPSKRRVRVEFLGRLIADSREAFRLLEKGHPPTWYMPPRHVDQRFFVPSDRRDFSDDKGEAHFCGLEHGAEFRLDAAWFYPEPVAELAAIQDYIAFHPGKVDGCWLDEELIQPRDGDFQGGWVSSDIAGPFKGSAGEDSAGGPER